MILLRWGGGLNKPILISGGFPAYPYQSARSAHHAGGAAGRNAQRACACTEQRLAAGARRALRRAPLDPPPFLQQADAQQRHPQPHQPSGSPAVKNSSRRSSCGQRLRGNFVAQALEASNELALDTHAVAFIEICRAEAREVSSAFEHVVGDDE